MRINELRNSGRSTSDHSDAESQTGLDYHHMPKPSLNDDDRENSRDRCGPKIYE